MEISHSSVGSDIYRAVIDLDRYLYLVENKYDDWYKGELFIARSDQKSKKRPPAEVAVPNSSPWF